MDAFSKNKNNLLLQKNFISSTLLINLKFFKYFSLHPLDQFELYLQNYDFLMFIIYFHILLF